MPPPPHLKQHALTLVLPAPSYAMVPLLSAATSTITSDATVVFECVEREKDVKRNAVRIEGGVELEGGEGVASTG